VIESYPSAGARALITEKLEYDRRAAGMGHLDVPDASVREIVCKNILQFVPGYKRVQIWNEWYRVLMPGGRVQVIVPYYSHVQAHAHPFTQWPPFSEFSFLFLDRAWRNASPTRAVDGLECDFEVISTEIDMDAAYATRSQEWKDEALRWFANCAVQLTVWLVKR